MASVTNQTYNTMMTTTRTTPVMIPATEILHEALASLSASFLSSRSADAAFCWAITIKRTTSFDNFYRASAQQCSRDILSVCLSVCLSHCGIVSKRLTSHHTDGLQHKGTTSTDVGTWTNWLTFEPDADHSLDAAEPDCFFRYRIGYGTLQPCIGCQRAGLLRGILRRENSTYTYWRRAVRASRGFKMVLFTEPSEDLCRR